MDANEVTLTIWFEIDKGALQHWKNYSFSFSNYACMLIDWICFFPRCDRPDDGNTCFSLCSMSPSSLSIAAASVVLTCSGDDDWQENSRTWKFSETAKLRLPGSKSRSWSNVAAVGNKSPVMSAIFSMTNHFFGPIWWSAAMQVTLS